MFNNPESACRTCGGLGVHKLTHPELLVPDPRRSIRGGCFVREAFKYNPDTWDGRVMYSLAKALRFLARHAVGEASRAGAPGDPERHRPEDRARPAAGGEGKPRRLGGQGGRLRRNRPADRAALPPLPAERRGKLGDGGLARQRDGRAHLPRLQRRAGPGHPAVLHHRRQDDPRARPAQLRRAARVPRHRQADRPRRRRRPAGAQGDPRPARAAPGHRPGLPEPQPPLGHALRRRVAADSSVHADRVGADGDALRARRAEHRPAPEGQREDDRHAREPARHRQHGHRRRARRGHHPRRRPPGGDGPRAGRPRRHGGRAGNDR